MLREVLDRDPYPELKKWLSAYADKEQFSGTVQVISKGNIIFNMHIGYADLEKNIPITGETRYRFYSLTKPFTAIGILKLYESGKLNLEDHPGKHLTCAAKLDKRITIKHLLQHTSGLEEIASADTMAIEKEVVLPEIIAALGNAALKFAPGTEANYCNTNYVILAMIIEQYHGMTIDAYLEKCMFQEMNMPTACCDMGNQNIPGLAVGYEKEKDTVYPAGYVNMKLISGAGCGVGSVADVMCLYDIIKNKKILKPDTWKLVFEPAPVGGFGLGCRVFTWNGRTVYQHNGGHVGFRTLHRYLPAEDFDIILLSNAGYGNARVDICEAIYETFLGTTTREKLPEMDKGFV